MQPAVNRSSKDIVGSIPTPGAIFPGVAQFGSAFVLGAKGRWFKSSHPDKISINSIFKT